MPQPNWLVTIGLAKESVWGTPVTPATTFLSSPTPVFTEKQSSVFDKGLRGIRSETQGMVFSDAHTEFDIPGMPWYGDDSGHLLMALLGADAVVVSTTKTGTIASSAVGATTLTYTVVGGAAPVTGDVFKIDSGTGTAETVAPVVTGAGPYTFTYPAGQSARYAHGAAAPVAGLDIHTMSVLNTASPPSYTLQKYDALVATARTISGCYFEDVTLKFTSPGLLTVDAKGRGKLGTNVAKPTAAYSAENFNVPWQANVIIAGAANLRVVDLTLSLKAPADLIYGMAGIQSPTAAVSDQLTVTGTITFVPDDYTEYNYYLNNTQPAVVVVLDNGSTRVTFQMTKTAFIDPVQLAHSGNYSMLTAAFEAIANSTDAGTGNAPIKVFLANAKASVY